MADIPTRIRRVELRCSDLEAGAGFYAALLELEAVRDGDRARLRVPGTREPLLVLRQAERAGPPPRRATGLFHTAFRYRDRAGLAAALRRLADGLGLRLSGAADHGVSEALYLDDPDGLGIELYRDRPLDEWPDPGPGERVRMFTAPLDLDDLATAGGGWERGPGGLDVGHVHLKVADPDAAAGFWTERMGMELMARFGPDTVFLAHDGYHHHVGANAWLSRGAGPEPADGPGLDAVAIRADPGTADAETPDGVRVLAEPERA